jgi:hypothetical protein
MAIRRLGQAISEHGRDITYRGHTPNLRAAGDLRPREHVTASLFASRQHLSSLGRIGLVGQNNGRERDSLIGAEISLIADLNSLQGRKKFPVRMLREFARKALV